MTKCLLYKAGHVPSAIDRVVQENLLQSITVIRQVRSANSSVNYATQLLVSLKTHQSFYLPQSPT